MFLCFVVVIFLFCVVVVVIFFVCVCVLVFFWLVGWFCVLLCFVVFSELRDFLFWFEIFMEGSLSPCGQTLSFPALFLGKAVIQNWFLDLFV